MNKPNEEENGAGDVELSVTNHAKPEMTLKAIAETMADPEFEAEQLPGLWQQITETGGAPLNSLRQYQWKRGIETMFRRCSTYLQYTKLTAAVFELPPVAWYDADRVVAHGNDLLEKASPAQLQQALTWEQQRPDGRQRPSNQHSDMGHYRTINRARHRTARIARTVPRLRNNSGTVPSPETRLDRPQDPTRRRTHPAGTTRRQRNRLDRVPRNCRTRRHYRRHRRTRLRYRTDQRHRTTTTAALNQDLNAATAHNRP